MTDGRVLAGRPADRPLAVAWLRALVATPGAAVISVVSAALLGWTAWAALSWLLLQAAPPWAPGELCAERTGACWPFLIEKLRFILFGTYPFDQHWRPALVSIALCALAVFAGLQALGRLPAIGVLPTVCIWLGGFTAVFVLMAGGPFGLPPVASVRWNGLPVLLIPEPS